MAGAPRPIETWRLLALLSPAALALAWWVSRAQWFWNHRAEMQFGWVVLLLSGFVLWDRWPERPGVRLRCTLWSGLLAAAGVALLLLFQVFHAAFSLVATALLLLTAGLMCIIAANIHYVFGGPGLRHFAFPFLFLLIALPIPSGAYDPFVKMLQTQIAGLNVELLALAGIPAERVGSLIHLPRGTVGVDEACSGIRSLQSTLMATVFIGHLALKGLGWRALLLACGLALAFAGNLGRSLYLSITANARGLEAIERVHDAAGWSVFTFTAAGVAALSWCFARAERWQAENAGASRHPPRRA